MKCDSKSAFLDIYEAQIEWYLEHFEIPRDYQEAILDTHTKPRTAYSDIESARAGLEKRLTRIKELSEMGRYYKTGIPE